MSKRLQVVMDDEEYDEVQDAADARRLTVSAWVRQTLRAARASDPESFEGGTRDGRLMTSTSPSPARASDETTPDPELVHRVMQRHGLATPAEAIDFALRRTVEPALTRGDMLSLRGSGWSGDLTALRARPQGTDESGAGSSS